MAAVTGKLQADFSSFYDAVTKAAASLTTLDSGASKAEGALTRMVTNFSGQRLIDQAQTAVVAVGKIGGATALTETEQAKLNALLDDAIKKYAALGEQAPADMIALRDATKRAEPTELTKTMGDLGTEIKGTMLGLISGTAILDTAKEGFRVLTEFVGDSITAYGNAELAAKKMTTALMAQGTATPQTIAAFNDLATQFQRTTVYSDDLINEMESLLTQVGNVAPAQMDAALTASTNLASGLGIDLKNATMLVAKAFAEGGESIGKLGKLLGDAYRPGMDMSEVLDAINSKFGGQAAAEAETYAGRIKQIANEWDNFKEAVGKAIVTDPQIVKLLDALQRSITGVGESAEKYQRSLSDYAAALVDLSGNTSLAIGWMNAADKAVTDLNQDIAKMKPPDPAPFKGFTDDITQRLKDLKAESEDFGEKTRAAWKKAEDEAKRFADAVDAAFKKYSGGAATEQMKILDLVFRKLADSGQITEQQLNNIADEAVKLQGEGARLTDRLLAIVDVTGKMIPNLSVSTDGMDKFGTAVKLAIPQEAQLGAELDVLGRKLAEASASFDNLGFKVSDGFKAGADAIIAKNKEMGVSIQNLETGFNTLATAVGGDVGKMIGDMGKATGALKDMRTSFADLKAGSASSLSGILNFSSGIMGMVSAAIEAGKAIGGLISKLFGMGTAGRDAVVSFANSMGGFDALHAKLDDLGESGEQLWIKLTQGVGRNDPAAAQAAIQQVTDALDQQKQAQQNAADVVTVSNEQQAQATVETATAAAAALDQVNSKLADNQSAWKDWSTAVTGFLNDVAQAVYNLPMPGAPGGLATAGGPALGGGTGTALLRQPAGGSGTINLQTSVQVDSREIARATADYVYTNGLNR